MKKYQKPFPQEWADDDEWIPDDPVDIPALLSNHAKQQKIIDQLKRDTGCADQG